MCRRHRVVRRTLGIAGLLAAADGRQGSGCDLGDTVRAYRPFGHRCTTSKRRCWSRAIILDGPGRNDAFLTVRWAGHYVPLQEQRLHASYVRRNGSGGRLCAEPWSLSLDSASLDGAWKRPGGGNSAEESGRRYFDACADKVGGVLPVEGVVKDCRELSLLGHCSAAEVAAHCPHSCGACEPLAECVSPQRMLPLFQQFATWGWYSQWHQDSVLHLLLVHPGGLRVPASERFFVEFGMHPMRGRLGPDMNSQYLRRLGWRGIAFDKTHEDPSWPLYREEITAENAVQVFERRGVPKSLGIITIDIDSCDFWVFLALAAVYRPRVYQVEYNRHHRFSESVTLDCRPGRPGASEQVPEELYGASLIAVAAAARARGYQPVWVERCFDVFFVREDLVCPGTELPSLEPFRGFSVHDGGCADPWGRFAQPATAAERARFLLDVGAEGVPL